MKKIVLFSIILILFNVILVSADIETGLVSHWKFDETSGTVAFDEKGLNNLSLIMPSGFETGFKNNGIYFNGSGGIANVTSPNGIPIGSSERTISFYIRPKEEKAMDIFSYGDSSPTGRNSFLINTASNSTGVYWGFVSGGSGNDLAFIGLLPLEEFTHIALTYSESSNNVSFYQNGEFVTNLSMTGNLNTLNSNNLRIGSRGWATPNTELPSFNGTIDEFYLFNRSLTHEDITEIYNSLSFNSVSLIEPANDFSISEEVNINFSASLNPGVSYNNTNATLFIYNFTGEIINQITNIVTGNTTNITSWNNLNFTSGIYHWNVLGCFNNLSGSTCNYANENRTFNIIPFEIINLTFNANVFETSQQNFSINLVTIPDVLSANARLNYEGIEYLSEGECIGTNCSFQTRIDIPLVTSGENETKTFNWIINVFDEDGSVLQFESEEQEQFVSTIYLGACSGGTNIQTLNFTAKDEQNLTRINPFKFLATFEYWLGTGSVYKNVSFNDASVAERVICLSNETETFKVNANIDYDEAGNSTDYTLRNYYLRNASLTNQSQDITLYLLKSVSSTSFIQEVRTSTFTPIENALIFLQRYYPEDNTYRTVQITKTDSNGKTVGFYETETVDYRHIIVKDGQVIYSDSDSRKIFPESAPFTITFTIGDEFENPWTFFDGIPNLQSSIVFNETSKIITYTYIDTSGLLSEARMIVELSGVTNQVLCDVSAAQSSGTLVCNVSSVDSGTILVKTYIGRSPLTLDKVYTFVINSLKNALAKFGLIVFFFMIIVSAFAALWNPTAAIVLVNGVSIIASFVGLYPFGSIALWGIIAISVYLIWELNT